MDIGMQPAEIRHASGRAHAAEKSVALDQERPPPGTRGRHRRRNPRGSATEDGDFIFAVQRNLASGFFNGFGRHGSDPIPDDFVSRDYELTRSGLQSGK